MGFPPSVTGSVSNGAVATRPGDPGRSQQLSMCSSEHTRCPEQLFTHSLPTFQNFMHASAPAEASRSSATKTSALMPPDAWASFVVENGFLPCRLAGVHTKIVESTPALQANGQACGGARGSGAPPKLRYRHLQASWWCGLHEGGGLAYGKNHRQWRADRRRTRPSWRCEWCGSR